MPYLLVNSTRRLISLPRKLDFHSLRLPRGLGSTLKPSSRSTTEAELPASYCRRIVPWMQFCSPGKEDPTKLEFIANNFSQFTNKSCTVMLERTHGSLASRHASHPIACPHTVKYCTCRVGGIQLACQPRSLRSKIFVAAAKRLSKASFRIVVTKYSEWPCSR